MEDKIAFTKGFQVFCNVCKKTFNSLDYHDISHFKGFFIIRSFLAGYEIIQMNFFGDSRKVLRAVNTATKKEFVFKIFCGLLTESQKNSFKALKSLGHPNLQAQSHIDVNKAGTQTSIRFEYIPTSLLTFIRKNLFITERIFWQYFLQIVTGVSYLHSKNIVHGYLELDSIFIVEDHGNEIIKVGGLDKITLIDDLKKRTEIEIGNIKYLAPEIIQGNTQDLDFRKVDVWTLGILMHQFLSKEKIPFQGSNLMETQNNIVRGNILINPDKHPIFTTKIQNLIQECLRDAKARCTLDYVAKYLKDMAD